jgi:hypothetical protein
MWKYLTLHETFIRGALAGDHGEVAWEELREFHDRQIAFMQHERLIHLIVTMFVAGFWLLSLAYIGTSPGWAGIALVALLLVLLAAYILHYFRMENGVQRMYSLANRIDERLGRTGATYDRDEIKINQR